jgi:hypothetical protein
LFSSFGDFDYPLFIFEPDIHIGISSDKQVRII